MSEFDELKNIIFEELKLIEFVSWLNYKLIGVNRIFKEIYLTIKTRKVKGRLSMFEYFVFRYDHKYLHDGYKCPKDDYVDVI